MGEIAPHFAALSRDMRNIAVVVVGRVVAHPCDDRRAGPLFNWYALRPRHRAAADGRAVVELRLDSKDGPVVGTLSISSTGSADKYRSFTTKVKSDLIPTGEIVSVEGTPFDFREGKPIGRDIDSDDEQMRFGGGYDHNFVIDGYTGDGSLLTAGEVYDPGSGRVMEVLTTLPGIQLYTSNGMTAEGGKNGRTYGPNSAYALETQFFPDNVHHDNFPKAIFGPGKDYASTTIYRFPACR